MSTAKKDKNNANPDNMVCGNCNASEGSDGAFKLSACSRCGLVVYCSKDCQRAHWKANHKQHCIAKADRAPQYQNSSDSFKEADSGAVSTGDKCAICQDILIGATATTLPCNHVFHSTCVEELRKFGVEQVCPLCRVPLPGIDQVCEEATLRYLVVLKLVKQGKASMSSLPDWAKQEVDAAVASWRASADEGNVRALYCLGHHFNSQRGLANSDTESASWYKKAAEKGFMEAQHNLGVMFKKGCGVVQSDTEAARWFQKAADQGDASAQYNLGRMFQDGRGVVRNEVEAFQWCKKAAEQGNMVAQTHLGNLYTTGCGVARNVVEAVSWYRKAAEQGEETAQCNLGGMFGEGRGVAKSYVEAFYWFKKAADQGLAVAQFAVGQLYEKGCGVSQNNIEAVRYLKMAAKQGFAPAQEKLRGMRL